jgi:methylated-DNA-protein-cysteine methyltransferase-like protein
MTLQNRSAEKQRWRCYDVYRREAAFCTGPAMTRTRKTQGQQLSAFEQVYEIVKDIPRGRVATYGQISKMMNGRLSAAAVGWAMHALGTIGGKNRNKYNSDTVPWHRVINSKGTLSTRHTTGVEGKRVKLQQVLLEKEGVKFEADSSVDLSRYLWEG